jgi:hypothetical protein
MATATRKPLMVKKPVAVTVEGARIVKSVRGRQEHVLLEGETVRLCGIDTKSWTEMVVLDTVKTNCLLCIEAVKARAKAATAA